MTIGVYAGRFQPFSKHHRAVVQFIDLEPDIDEIVIIKGSSQWSDQNPDIHTSPSRHPFTAQECCEMINLSLAGRIKKPYRIEKVLDTKTIMTDPFWQEWVGAVLTAVGTKKFVVYVNDPKMVRAFGQADIECRPFPIDFPGASATVIRKNMAYCSREVWAEDVDPVVADYLEMIDGPVRVRRLWEGKINGRKAGQ